MTRGSGGTATRSKPTAPGHRTGRKDAAQTKKSAPSQVAFAPLKQDDDNDTRRLLFSMDYGTKTLCVAFRFAQPGEAPTLNNVHDINFSERLFYAPQAVAWGPDGTFYWGKVCHRDCTGLNLSDELTVAQEIDNALKKKLITPEDVIELWKLLLYKTHEESEMVKQIKAQLVKAKRSLEELISTHLRAIIKEAKSIMKRTLTSEYTFEVSAAVSPF